MTYTFEDEEAVVYGINAATVLSRLRSLVYANRSLSANAIDKKHFVYIDYEAWLKLFPFFTEMDIKEALQVLRSNSLIIIKKDKENRKMYTLYSYKRELAPRPDQKNITPLDVDDPKRHANHRVDPLESVYQDMEKSKKHIGTFIARNKPAFVLPYFEMWNIFAAEYGFPKVDIFSESRKSKIRVRLKEAAFDFVKILGAAAKAEQLKGAPWFNFDWIIKSEDNYVKLLSGNYDKSMTPQLPKEDVLKTNQPIKLWQENESVAEEK